jgi:hypothetical protein
MRIFLRFSVGLFRQKTDRIDVQSNTTTDELLEIVAIRTGKSQESFVLSYRQEQTRVDVELYRSESLKGGCSHITISNLVLYS